MMRSCPQHRPGLSSLEAASTVALTRRPAGFTLVELIVASIILTLVVGAVTMLVSQMLRSRDAASAAGDAFARAQLAAVRIATDAGQALRDAELTSAKVSIIRGGPAGKNAQGLLVFTHLDRPVRTTLDAHESDEYEVQFRLEPAAIVPSSSARSQPTFALWRRADPIPDEVYDGGGVAAPIVDGVTALAIDAYDGAEWRTDWDSDADGYPHALRFTVTATDDAGRRTATARRVVAFDRTPKPIAEEAAEDTDDSGSQPTTTGSGTTGTTGGTGGTGGTGTGGTGGGAGGGGGRGGRP